MRTPTLMAAAAALGLCGAAALAAPAPVPPKPSAETLQGLLGKNHFSPEMYSFRELMNEPPKAVYHDTGISKGFVHNWESKGVSLCFDEQCKVVNISLYAGISDEPFQPYKGELPAGLTFKDAPAAIKKKLGEPDWVLEGTWGAATSKYSYSSKGLYIHFNDYGVPGPKSRIAFVIMFVPKPKRPGAPPPGADGPP